MISDLKGGEGRLRASASDDVVACGYRHDSFQRGSNFASKTIPRKTMARYGLENLKAVQA